MENGEVIAILDITKCLYDAISRMQKAAEQGSVIAAAVEGVERPRGSNASGWLTIIFISLYTHLTVLIVFEVVNYIHLHAYASLLFIVSLTLLYGKSCFF